VLPLERRIGESYMEKKGLTFCKNDREHIRKYNVCDNAMFLNFTTNDSYQDSLHHTNQTQHACLFAKQRQ
jgi:hypothetical protein